MKFLILGAGMMGRAAAFDLARSEGAIEIVLADMNKETAEAARVFAGSERVLAREVDVTDHHAVVSLMKGRDAVISAVPYGFNHELAKAAVEAQTNFCDLGGNNHIVEKELSLDKQAKEAGITIIPDCGLAPGLVSILAANAASRLDELEELQLRVGGLPQNPKPPLNYKIVFSPSGLINEYKEKAVVIRKGRVETVEAMTELEEIEFPEPFGKLEAFTTSGGTSTLPKTFLGKVNELDYKTIRYKGHCDLMKTMLELGFGDEVPLKVGSQTIVPREFFESFLLKRLSDDDGDVVLVRVVARGIKKARDTTLSYTIIDYADQEHGVTAMMRMTAFPITIVAWMLASGIIIQKGAVPQELCVPPALFIEEMKRRRVAIRIEESYCSGAPEFD